MKEQLLTIKNLRAWYQAEKYVLSEFSMELKRNEVVGLIGLNGAGKTTFMKLLSGLHDGFAADEICMTGSTWKNRMRGMCEHKMRRGAGKNEFQDNDLKKFRYTVFAEDNSFGYFTFWEYISYVFAAYGKKKPDVTDLVQGFHFQQYADVLMKELSTGNKKKAFLITAFALKPELLMLDEPVNGLDFESTEFLYQLIAGYREYGTVLFSSHILESITLTSDRVLVLEEGKIRQCFKQEEIDATQIREALRYENDV